MTETESISQRWWKCVDCGILLEVKDDCHEYNECCVSYGNKNKDDYHEPMIVFNESELLASLSALAELSQLMDVEDFKRTLAIGLMPSQEQE